ncbi:hypothetical protein TSAR_016063 [Trichomalopsis sarcophagae]|uniref:Uncharacterized protein n=1 Tax=Trichomalopsis sarcophagae TaxID=543379 RepID=A0A232ETJ3_9HYME|nr:hypothetical protein TSAR_016063 [Trichomalopsis sarcophagae]
MEVSITDIVKYFMCIVFITNRCAADFADFSDILDIDLTILESKRIAREPRKYEGNSWIWQDYEFGSGVGNREELHVTNIEIWQDFELADDVQNWQVLKHENNIYFGGTKRGSLLLYHFDVKAKHISLHANISTNETIKAFKIISLSQRVDESLESNVIVVLSVENKNQVYYLKWFYLHDNRFFQFWTWKIEKSIKILEYFYINGRDKLLLLYENDVLFNERFSAVEIYDIKINRHLSKFQLCDRFLVTDTYDLQLCPPKEDTVMISLLGKNHVKLYEYKDQNIIKCTFKEIKSITLSELTNVVCFQSGYINYLATSGLTSNLFKLLKKNNFHNDEEMEDIFHGIGDIKSIQYLPVNTYRNEVLLLIQLKNSTTVALSWNGSNFKRIAVTDKKLNKFDLSRLTAIPNYGFLIGNSLIKIDVQLKQLSKSNKNIMKNMLETKTVLQGLLDNQEQIIVKTDQLIKQSTMTDLELKNFINSSYIEINELHANKTDDSLITFGSHNISLNEMQHNYEDAMMRINRIEMQFNKIEDIMITAALNLQKNRDYHEVNFEGNLRIKGKLVVNNFTIEGFNNSSLKSLLSQCAKNKLKIMGQKWFPSIEFANNNFKLRYLNGIPLSNIQFDELNKDYSDIDLSNISKLELIQNLNVSVIRGTHWNNLTEKVVFRNAKKVIPESTTLIGQMDVGHIRLDYLNELKYPYNYVLKSDPEEADITSDKTFQSIRVTNLQDVKTINGIDADEFIILNADQSLKNQITFENVVIDKRLQIDGSIVGTPEQDIDPDMTLLNSNIVQSNAMFTNLYISGNVYVKNSINGTNWLKLNDLILDGEDDVLITGTKTFLENVHIVGNLEIKTGIINNHSVRDFMTLDTRQILRNLSSISGNVKFINVAYEELKNLEDKMNTNFNDKLFYTCISKPLIFIVPPIIDEFSSLYINENLNGSEFSNKIESLLENSFFEHLKVKKLVVENLTTALVNSANFLNFEAHKISKTGYQSLSGNITIENLVVENLYTELVNGRSASDLENMIRRINLVYNDIFNGNVSIHSVNVTKFIVTSKINEEDLNDVLDVNFIEQFIFKTNQTIKNLIVEGLVNKINITRKANDLVLYTQDDVILKGPKKMKKLKSSNLTVDFMNGHSIKDVLSSKNNQFLVGPLKITGSVTVEKVFESNGKFNDIVFQNISSTVHQLDEKLFKLNGEFFIVNESLVKDLNVYGYTQKKSMDNFVENLIFLNENIISVSGKKIFSDSVNFVTDIFLRKNLNKINLENFFQTTLLNDIPIFLNSRIMFNSDILVGADIVIQNNLQATAIKRINIEELMENAVYLNRPTFIPEATGLFNVIFQSDITVDTWNNTGIDRFLLLNKQEVIRNTLMCVDITADKLEVEGFINSKNLAEIYENTLTLSTNQNIIGTVTFLNNIYIKDNFDAQLINKIYMNKITSLKYADQVNGNFVFHNRILFNNKLRVYGNLNGHNMQNWQSSVATIYSPRTVLITGNWMMQNPVLEKSLYGLGLINGIHITKLRENIVNHTSEMKSYALEQTRKSSTICQELQRLKSKAENMLYKFKSFEYLRVLDFDQTISSVHHFELRNTDYMMVNFESCNLDVFAYTNKGFVLAANISNFGYVKQFITLHYKDHLYFVTFGKSDCGRNSGNLWSLENNQFKYVLDLGNVTDIQKLDNDAFVVVVNDEVQEYLIENIYENSFKPVNVIPIKAKDVQIFTNANETLLASHDTIFRLRSEVLEFEEYENPFDTNKILPFQAGISQKDYILFFDERISKDYIYLCNNDLSQRKVLQTIKTCKPNSFLVVNFHGYQESLLIYLENKRKILIYEYKGIEEFKYHSSIKMKSDKLFSFQLKTYPYNVKSQCLVVIQDYKLVILKAVMFGEKLSMNEKLQCNVA